MKGHIVRTLLSGLSIVAGFSVLPLQAEVKPGWWMDKQERQCLDRVQEDLFFFRKAQVDLVDYDKQVDTDGRVHVAGLIRVEGELYYENPTEKTYQWLNYLGVDYNLKPVNPPPEWQQGPEKLDFSDLPKMDFELLSGRQVMLLPYLCGYISKRSAEPSFSHLQNMEIYQMQLALACILDKKMDFFESNNWLVQVRGRYN